MHKIEIPPEVIGRIVARRGKLHVFDAIDVLCTAQIVVDLQNGFMAPGQPAEIVGARDIVPNVNRISETLRRLGGVNVFIQNTIDDESRKSWSNWFGYFVSEERQRRMDIAFEEGSHGHALWSGLDIAETDLKVLKRRFSAFTPGTSKLHNVLQARGVDTLIITGTATNVCCELTARDAQMLNYKVIFVSDGCATYTDAVHNATLCSMMTNFADVMTTDEVVALLHRSSVTRSRNQPDGGHPPSRCLDRNADGLLTVLGFLIGRIALSVPILLGVSIMVFALIHMAPGNALDLLLPPEASPEVIARIKIELGYDQPLIVQYFKWLMRVLQGNFGSSIFSGRPVIGELLQALSNTMVIAIPAAILGFTLGATFGLLAAKYGRRWPDKVFSAIAISSVSLPHYWVAIVLVMIFSATLNILPAQGMSTEGTLTVDGLKFVILPIITLSLVPMGVTARMTFEPPRSKCCLRISSAHFTRVLNRAKDHLARHQERSTFGDRDYGAAVRLFNRRINPGRDGVQLARLRQSAQPRNLPSRHPDRSGYHSVAGSVIRLDQPDRRYHSGLHRPANASLSDRRNVHHTAQRPRSTGKAAECSACSRWLLGHRLAAFQTRSADYFCLADPHSDYFDSGLRTAGHCLRPFFR